MLPTQGLSSPQGGPSRNYEERRAVKRRCSSFSGPSSENEDPKHSEVPSWMFPMPWPQLLLTNHALHALKIYQDASPTNSGHAVPTFQGPSDLEPIIEHSAEEILQRSSEEQRDKVKRFALDGGPDLRDLRGWPFVGPNVTMRARPSGLGRPDGASGSHSQGIPTCDTGTTTTNTTATKNTSPYDGSFQQHLIKNEIYPSRYKIQDGTRLGEPDNVDEIRLVLGQPRPSLSPSQFSESAFDTFLDLEAAATQVSRAMDPVLRVIEGEQSNPKPRDRRDPFSNLDYLTSGRLVPGNPDIYYGARSDQLRDEICEQLSHKIQPSTDQDSPLLPNFFLRVKGPDGSPAMAARQACYDGAIGARGLHSLQCYGLLELPFDNKAYTLTSTYQDGYLRMYATHPIPTSDPDRTSGFAMTQIKAYGLNGDIESFRQGAAAYRNGRDWAKQQRDNAINQANERYATAAASASTDDECLGLTHASDA